MIQGALLALLLAVPAAAQTEVKLALTGAAGQPNPGLALPPFEAEDPKVGSDAVLAKDLREIVRQDLMLSRRFEVTDENASASVKGATWRLTAKAAQKADKVSVRVKLANAVGGEAVFERFYRQDAAWTRALAHRIADDIVKAATGRDGIARTRIAFANNKSGHKEIWVMDYDGDAVKRLTDHRSISLLPRFSPDGRSLAYTSYKDGNPDLWFLDLETGHSRIFSSEQGLNIAGGFSPDGTKILMTLSRGKSPNLFIKEVRGGAPAAERLTQHFGADSTPTFSPDARQVAFVSDRSGNPQIHVLDIPTKKITRLTSLNWCDAPAWSPTGEWIAFTGRAHNKDKMDIFLVDITGGQLRQLTHGEGSNEDPAWSPDGRFIAFSSTRGKRSQIWVMDSDGSAPRLMADVPG
ncbi:MAG: hypothetical protein Q7J64_00855, partial [Elusimicrobiota bacterium]|nr:hypothetical protein [Elusimicrobiota bacterium]